MKASKGISSYVPGRGEWLALLVVLAGACMTCGGETETGLTGIDLTVSYDSSLDLDQISLSGTLEGEPAFEPGTLPRTPRKLSATGESAVILLPEELGGSTILLRADGLAQGTVLASGTAEVALRARELVPAEISLQGSACSNGIDDDGDQFTDTDDPGCSDPDDQDELGDAACDNGIDDDLDGRTDYRPGSALGDPGCKDPRDDGEKCTAGPSCPQCDDGVDNDGDGMTDLGSQSEPSDLGCADPDDQDERCSGDGCAACDNGVDDDGDGLTDFHTDPAQGDPGCKDPRDNGERCTAGPSCPQCDNELDDDGDNLTDFPDDSQCTDPRDDQEDR